MTRVRKMTSAPNLIAQGIAAALPCAECTGTGMTWPEPYRCNCGTGGIEWPHEPYCGAEPCPNGCPVVKQRFPQDAEQ